MKALLFPIVPILLLQGCVSIVQTVSLDRAGGGEAMSVVKGDGETVTLEKLRTFPTILDGAKVVRKEETKDGIPTRTESVAFGDLSEIGLQLGAYSLHPNGTPGGMTFSHRMQGSGNRQPHHDELVSALQGESYVLTVRTPGDIAAARPVEIEGRKYHPVQKGREVTWSIPMPVLMEVNASTVLMEFTVDYTQ